MERQPRNKLLHPLSSDTGEKMKRILHTILKILAIGVLTFSLLLLFARFHWILDILTESAIKQFTNAPMPCYITVGNHDFHDDGLIVDKFLDDIGPLNHAFTIQNLRYVNIDTAASFMPVSGGKRATLVKSLVKDTHEYDDTVTFTHRSFYDPRPDEDHDFGNVWEKNWFVESLKRAKINTLLAGHIHSYFDTTSEDIRIIIAGQGLGHEDLIYKKQVAKIVVGKVSAGQAVEYRTEDLAMPIELHCHPYIGDWRKDNDDPFAKKINTLCEPIDAKTKFQP